MYQWEKKGFYPIPSNGMNCPGYDAKNLKIVVAEGRSMEPEIHDRDKLLFVEGGEVEEGDIIVVSCRDRLFIKGIKKEVSRRPSIGDI